MKRLLAAALLFLTPSTALADAFSDREAAYFALSAIDTVQTCDFLKRGVAREINPIFGKNPSCERIVATKIVGGAIHYVIAKKLNESDPEAARIFQITSIVIQSGVVMWNIQFAF